MNFKNIVLSAGLIGALYSSSAMASEMVAMQKEGDVTVTIAGTYLNASSPNFTAASNTTTGNTTLTNSIAKKQGWGAGLTVNYFMNGNTSLEAGIGYNKFSARKSIVTPANATATPAVNQVSLGIKTRYIPIRVGFNIHGNSFSGLRPFVGAGFQYSVLNYKSAYPIPAANGAVVIKGKNTYGAYAQLGADFYATEEVGMQLKVLKSFMGKKTTVTFNNGQQTANVAPAAGTSTVYRMKPGALEVSLGFVIGANN